MATKFMHHTWRMTTKYHVHLPREDRQELEVLIHNGKSSARTQTRARILLLTDEVSKTLHDTPRGTLPLEAGQQPRQDYEYERNGTAIHAKN